MKKIRSIEDISLLAGKASHILTLFSGGLDSTYLLELLNNHGFKVTALVVDLGDEIDRSALLRITGHYGAELVVVDASKCFIEHSLIAAIQANACYLGQYPVSSSLSRPVIVQYAVETAAQLGCDAILHTANQSQNSLRRLNGAIERSGYDGFYGSPYEYSAISREEKITSLSVSGLFEFKQRAVSGDSNLWCREFESGSLDNPENFDLDESLFHWSVWREEHQLTEHDHEVEITFYKGLPTKVNGQVLSVQSMVKFLNRHVGSYQIGRFIGFDHLEGNEKVLEIREAPAAAVLMSAYQYLESAILEIPVLQSKAQMSQLWTNEAVEGRWGSTLQQSAQAFIEHTAQHITGSVTFSLTKGQMFMARIVAENARYLTDRDAWEIQVANERSQRNLIAETKIKKIVASA